MKNVTLTDVCVQEGMVARKDMVGPWQGAQAALAETLDSVPSPYLALTTYGTSGRSSDALF